MPCMGCTTLSKLSAWMMQVAVASVTSVFRQMSFNIGWWVSGTCPCLPAPPACLPVRPQLHRVPALL